MKQAPVYLDHAATTPLDDRVRAAMLAAPFGNPSSIHIAGRAAADAVALARRQVAELIGAPPDSIVFTSGATESDNIAIAGAARYRAHRGRHLISMPTEHKAVRDTLRALQKDGFDVTWLSPDSDGRLHPDRLAEAMRADTQLVSVMHVNNETGIMQDIAGIGALCRARDVLFHTDAAQSAGKCAIDVGDMPIDLLSLTAHKFHGPQGIGALYIADRPGCRVVPVSFGGGQERRIRPGTLAVELIVGLGHAAMLAQAEMQADRAHARRLQDRLVAGIEQLPGVLRNGAATHCCAGIVNYSIEGVEGESLMLALEPVCVASGSACNSTSGESSYVLRALGRDDLLAQSALRFSFGRGTSAADIDTAIERLHDAVGRLRRIAAA